MTAPSFPELRRMFESVMLHARESSIHGDMDRDACVAMADLATAAKLLGGIACRVVDASDRAAHAMEDVAVLLAEIGSAMNTHFTRDPLTAVDLRNIRLDERSKAMREEAA